MRFVVILFMIACSYLHAQTRPFIPSGAGQQRPLFPNSFTMVPKPVSLVTKYELPRGAVFCRMEERLWRRFDVWIKLRAGNDDMYRLYTSGR